MTPPARPLSLTFVPNRAPLQTHCSTEMFSAEQALEFVQESADDVTELRRRAAELRAGMDIFAIPQPPYKELTSMEKELDLMKRMWGTVKEWDDLYVGWKDSKFRDIEVWRVGTKE